MPNLFRVEPPMNPSPSEDNVIANTQLLKNTVGFTCKNLFEVSPYNNLAIFGDSQGAYINSQTNGVSYLAHVEKNKDYTISKNSGVGDSFIIAGFATQPTIPNTTPEANSEVIIDDSSLNSYTFNSDDYEYIAFTVNKTTSGTLTDIQAMICDADLLDKSYEEPSVFGTVKQQLDLLNSPLTTQGLSFHFHNYISGGYKYLSNNLVFVQLLIQHTGTAVTNVPVSGLPPVKSNEYGTLSLYVTEDTIGGSSTNYLALVRNGQGIGQIYVTSDAGARSQYLLFSGVYSI